MSTITVTAGIVPGAVEDVVIRYGSSIYDALMEAARVAGQKAGLGRPAFEVRTSDYEEGGQRKVMVPQVDGVMLGTQRTHPGSGEQRWEDIPWNRRAENGEMILIVPQIQGNQYVVRVNGKRCAIYGADDPNYDGPKGNVQAALEAAGIELNWNSEIRVNGCRANPETLIRPNVDIQVTNVVEEAAVTEEVDGDELTVTIKGSVEAVERFLDR